MARILQFLFLITLLGIGVPVEAASRNCDSNAMIYCGVASKDELIRKITHGDGQHSAANIRSLFNSYDIQPADIRSASTVNGVVRKDGTVWIGQKRVATNAYSYGRENISGSTKQGALYKRPTSLSFDSASLPAYVHMNNGKFQWAIIKSCGNLVTAKAIVPKKTAAPPSAQPIVVQQTVVQQVVHNNVVHKAPVAPVKALPQTGLESSLPLAAAIGTISGGIGLSLHSRQRLRKALMRAS